MVTFHFPNGRVTHLPVEVAAKRSRIDCRFNGATVEASPEELAAIQAELGAPPPVYLAPRPVPKDLKPLSAK